MTDKASSVQLPWWRRISLSRKLQFSIAGYSLLVLLIVSSTLAWFVHNYFHQKEQQDLQMLAEVIADNSRAAVTFNDARSATNVLASARGNPHILMALIIKDEQIFASYPAELDLSSLELPPPGRRIWFSENHYYASVPLVVGNEVKGWLYLKSDLAEWQTVKRSLYLVFLGLLLGLLALTLIVSLWLNRHITFPLGALAQWAHQVSKAKDFNARAEKQNDDEVGNLVDSLNLMLSELSKQESILSINETLEREIRVRKEVEKDLIQMRNRADMANKAKSQFLANMSHELRTPLNAIIGYSEMLQEIMEEEEINREELHDDIGKIHSAGRHLLNLINDVLDISKIEAGKLDVTFEEFNVNDLIAEVLGTIRPLAETRQNQLVVDASCDLGVITSDPTKVRQILLNLLSNAVKFTLKGQVKLSCGRETTEAGEQILLRVKDSGIGISPEHLQTIFQPFSQADTSTTRKYGGTGLGLAISSSFVELLGGTITVDSRVGEGTTFTVTLPVGATPVARTSQLAGGRHTSPAPSRSADDTQQSRLLIIDDDEVVHSLLRHQLAQMRYDARSAYSGAEGLKIAREETFDVILLDVFMEGLDGWQVLQNLKADPATARIPVVLYSIATEHDKGYALGAADYLVKPVTREKLASILERYRHTTQPAGVLLIGADVDTVSLVLEGLAENQVRVVLADNTDDALEKLRSNPHLIVLLDLQLQGENGFDFIEQIKARSEFKDIPIVVLSHQEFTEDERNLLHRHARAIFRKGTYDKQAFINTLEEILTNQVDAGTKQVDAGTI